VEEWQIGSSLVLIRKRGGPRMELCKKSAVSIVDGSVQYSVL